MRHCTNNGHPLLSEWRSRHLKLNTQEVPSEDLVPFHLWMLAFSVAGFSILFIGSTLNALNLYIKYTARAILLHTYIVWYTSVHMKLHVHKV